MKNKVKLFITFSLLVMVVGMAVVATSFAINGSTLLAGNMDDFKVYFSKIEETSTNPNSEIEILSRTKLSFQTKILDITDVKTIQFDITNSSENYDAEISITCEGTNEYIGISYDLADTIPARSTITGNIEIKLLKTYAGSEEFTKEITCTLNANAIERTSLGTSSVPAPLIKTYSVGDVISIGDEKFNVTKDNGDTVTMLAQYNIGPDNRQSTELYGVTFSDTIGWKYSPGPIEIDVQIWGGESKTVLNNYTAYIQEVLNDATITGDLITLKELESLGCIIPPTYGYPSLENRSCGASPNIDWLNNEQTWWIRSARSDQNNRPWVLSGKDNYLYSNIYSNANGIRPIITISKETLEYVENYKTYDIGAEVSILNEKFNVISQTVETVTMLAQYNLGPDYRQSKTENNVTFSESNGWEYTPGPKEIDIQLYDGNAKTYINKYVDYLVEVTQDASISGDLITLKQLKKIGCTVTDDYSDGNSCAEYYGAWLKNDQAWWTRSANSGGGVGVWLVYKSGVIGRNAYNTSYTIRPVIKISKETLKYIESYKIYEIGEEVSIDEEKFNVVSQTVDTVTMLAQKNVDNYTPHKQTDELMWVRFYENNIGEYEPGTYEVKYNTWSKHLKDLLNNYKTYLKSEYNVNVTTDIITLSQLDKLGCSVPSDHTWGDGNWSCLSTKHSGWLINGQYWWTKSADSNNINNIWFVNDMGLLYFDAEHLNGVRPLVTINKNEL